MKTKPTLYVVSTSHLDTQWNWTVQDTIRELLPATFRDNFRRLEEEPAYTFTHESAIHYLWLKEYYPEEWPALERWVASGRWRLAGGWLVAADTHVPSPESLMRQALYGQGIFRRELGRVARDVFLPDCFGFGFALPSIARHSGLEAFSTQKLVWGASPPPFAVGRWKGVDGSWLVAALRGGDYIARLTSDVSTDESWHRDLVDVGGRKVGLRYFGVGDQGGAPDAESVAWLGRAVANRAGKVTVRSASVVDLARDLTAAEKAALPEYEGELLLPTHGVGCYTSQAAMKAWNRRNEQLADAAERACVAAALLGGPAYPREALRQAWMRFLWHQFHDDLTGTSIPQAYQISWNDELTSLNQLAGITTGAVAAVASGLDTRVEGVPLVVYNPLGLTRRDAVEARVRFPRRAPAAVTVIDTATGEPVPAQVLAAEGATARVVFLAELPPVAFRVFDVRPARTAAASPLTVTTSSLANERLTVRLDTRGDVVSVFDRVAGGELLAGPARLELLDDPSPRWPAWEILWSAVKVAPRALVGGRPRVRVLERGPARVGLEVTRTAGGSTFVQRLRLAAGGDRLEIETTVDWRTPETLLKAAFRLAARNPKATWDLGLGTIERGNARADRYEVPGQQWADLTDAGGEFGVAILNDGKYGWDKPADDTLRLTLLHTPMVKDRYVYQATNDIGRHRFTYAIAGHAGDWRAGRVPAVAARLNAPLLAFQPPAHPGPLGRAHAVLTIAPDGGGVALRALKQAEDSGELVVRVQELEGRPQADVRLAFAAPVVAAREVNAAEEPIGRIAAPDGELVFDLWPYGTRTFAVTLRTGPPRLARPESLPLELPYDVRGATLDSDRAAGRFDDAGHSLPAEQLPATLEIDGVVLRLGPTAAGAPNALAARGQRLPLPAGGPGALYLLAAATGGDVEAALRFLPRGRGLLRVAEWQGGIGSWDSPLVDDRLLREPHPVRIDVHQRWPLAKVRAGLVVSVDEEGRLHGAGALRPAFVKRDRVAWVATHRHSPGGNDPYLPGTLFVYRLPIPPDATAVVLPRDERVRVLAATVARGDHGDTAAAGELYAPEISRLTRK